MPQPIALCLEDLDTIDEARRFLQCTALADGEPGLALDDRGAALWRSAREEAACALVVAADGRLTLHHSAHAAALRLRRSGRELLVGAEHRVVLLDQDELTIGGRRLRLHVHGAAPEGASPAWIRAEPQAPPGLTARSRIATATALALGAAIGTTGCQGASAEPPPQPLQVRVRPPRVAPRPRPDAGPGQREPPKPKPTKKIKKKTAKKTTKKTTKKGD